MKLLVFSYASLPSLHTISPSQSCVCAHNTHTHTCTCAHMQSIDMGAIVDPTQRKSIDEYAPDRPSRMGRRSTRRCACMPLPGLFLPSDPSSPKSSLCPSCVQEEVGQSNYQQGEFRSVSVSNYEKRKMF